jgi:transcriptional regulator with XRE-family HTH domain
VRELSRQLGARIRRMRQTQNRTQAWLAAEIGVHVNTVARWERFGINPEHRALPRIAITLDCLAELLAVLRRERSRARAGSRNARSSGRAASAASRLAARRRARAPRP